LQNVVAGLIDKQNAMIEADGKLTENLNSMFKSFVDSEDSKSNKFAESLREYLNRKIDEFTNYGIKVYDPTTGKSAPFITAINNAYDWARIYGLFTSQFDALDLTCEGLESLEWACRDLETAHTKFKNWDPNSAGSVTVDGEHTGSLPADISTTVADMSAALVNVSAALENMSATVTDTSTTVADMSATVTDTSATLADMSTAEEAQRLTKIVPGRGNPMGTTLPGTLPPADTQFIIQAGSATSAVDESGDFSFKWSEPFSTAVLSVQLTSGDSTAHSGTLALRPSTTLTTCNAHATGNTSGAVRCDYIAIGY